jgi:DNA polymerase-3 subunit gamma/tau
LARARSTDTVARSNDPDVAYQVVARRYRPQTLAEVVGQEHVVQALRNAIRMKRVTHAYVFSGTRGVGKTSIARIFAKCLNCEQGPTETPCNTCDICQSISLGQDVDVIEIDGASNNGVEQVRELRQNASLRPSRSRYKIYYIDEVHMLSPGAFNALLKTLEEPPEHVKFFFATTEPGKIPITVLSRCQRFDFAGIRPDAIAETLLSICEREGVKADRDALLTVARRAAGAMRDAQSLLEQLLSSGHTHVTEQVVHDALGLAPDERVLELIDSLADHDPARALTLVDEALCSGVQAADLLSSLLDFLRDVMVLAAGAGTDLLGAAPSARARLAAVAQRWPIDTVLVTLQILSEARLRMRGSAQPRLLVELAVCRAARLEDFAELSELLARLDGERAAPSVRESAPAEKKKPVIAPEPAGRQPASAGTRGARAPARAPVPEPALRPEPTAAPDAPGADEPDGGAAPVGSPEATPEHELAPLRAAWARVAAELGGSLGKHMQRFSALRPAEADVLEVDVPAIYHFSADACESADNLAKIEAALRAALGRPISLHFQRQTASQPPMRRESPQATRALRHEDLESDVLVQDLVKLFEARPIHVELDDEADLG